MKGILKMSKDSYRDLMLEESRKNVLLKIENSHLKDALVDIYDSLIETADGLWILDNHSKMELQLLLQGDR